MIRKLTIAAVALIVLLSGALYVVHAKTKAEPLRVLVLYKEGSDSYLDALQQLNQTLVVNARIEQAKWPEAEGKLDSYDAVYLDRALSKDTPEAERFSSAMESYVKGGGALFAENEFYDVLPLELLGAKSFVKLDKLPAKLLLPKTEANANVIQTVVSQFHRDLSASYDKDRLADVALGMGMVPGTAKALAKNEGGIALYAMNRYGNGTVFFSSALLPNHQYVTGFDMQPRSGEDQSYFNFMFATGSYELRSAFLDFLSKEKLGYAVTKVLGTNGRPAMAWQNHFEVSSSLQEGGMEKWIDYVKQYNEIPSFSLARETYEWGLWKEGLVVYPNKGAAASPAFEGENVNSQYSSGDIVHLASGEAFSQASYPEYKSLGDPIELPYRTYEDVRDVNGDGVPDVVAGSADGSIRLYVGRHDGGEWSLEPAQPVMLANGSELRVGSYSAPALADLNGDGKLDLVVGSGDGRVRTYTNVGNFSFRDDGDTIGVPLTSKEAYAYAAPAVGDVNGDGIADLAVGMADGSVMLHVGELVGNSIRFDNLGQFLITGHAEDGVTYFSAPRIVDYDGDGQPELLVGYNDGYIRQYAMKNGPAGSISLGEMKYVQGETLNPAGDNRLWGGHNAVPAAADVNGDGLVDLIVGELIFGFPTPIDDPRFPAKEQLKQALDYAGHNFIPIQPHLFFHSYESPVRELEEIDLHKKAFEAYGIPWTNVGTNQHTWRINNLVPGQTIREEMKSGIWWNSGFRPSGNPYEPTLAGEYLWTMPFLLANKEQQDPFIVSNPAPNIAYFKGAFESYAALDMPFSYFYHMEYPILKSEADGGFANKVQFLDQFRNQYDYNFMTEDQSFRSYMAAYQADSSLGTPLIRNAMNVAENVIRTKKQLSFEVKTGGLRELNGSAQLDQKLQDEIEGQLSAVGYKVELGAKYKGYVPVTDAPISMYRGSTLYFGGTKDATVTIQSGLPTSPGIERANLLVNIDRDGSEWHIDWQGSGMQQVKLYAPRGLDVLSDGDGWSVEKSEDGKHYVLTRFGDVVTLNVRFK
ncbi:FG-GAP repeat domain-containing protein [Cohnella yongneupensis]|uniref:FG-GAP repeat domain-containing protein n=1 Tax=Cohnella yongneupensis TaxID=425006 RepID=A0ABW0R7B0_9BACL